MMLQQPHSPSSFNDTTQSTIGFETAPLQRGRLKKPYVPPYFMPNGMAFAGVMVGVVVFLAAFSGPSWYVVPPELTRQPMEFGLWRLCVRSECVVEMTNDYMVKRYLVDPAQGMNVNVVIPAFEQYLMPVKALMCVAFLFLIAAVACNMAFIAGYPTFFLEGILTLLAGILVSIAVAVFGGAFRDPLHVAPFGWAFWTAVVAAAIFLACGIVLTYISVLVFRKRGNSFWQEKKIFMRY